MSSHYWHILFSPLLNVSMAVHCAASSLFLCHHHQYAFNRNEEAQRIVCQPEKVNNSRIMYLIQNENSKTKWLQNKS